MPIDLELANQMLAESNERTGKLTLLMQLKDWCEARIDEIEKENAAAAAKFAVAVQQEETPCQ